jgi:hypothetical protein
LISSITREEVDKHSTRCPHPETAERMVQVSLSKVSSLSAPHDDLAYYPRQRCSGFYWWYCYLCYSQCSWRPWRARFRQVRG